MHYQGFSVVTLGWVCCLSMACGGQSEGTAGAPEMALREQVGSPRPPFLSGYARSMAKAKGNGFAQFSSCASGSLCAGDLANAAFQAEFSRDDSGEDAGSPCTTTAEGACVFVSCYEYAGSAPGVPAGTLTIAGGTMGTVNIKTNSLQDFVYSFSDAESPGFSVGDTLSVSGSGGKVPAFATQSLIAPGLVTLTSPVADAKGEFDIATSSALKVTWTGGVSGESVYVEGGPNAVSSYEYFACGWDATAGKGTVPAKILALVAKSAGSFAWGNQGTVQTFSTGGYAVDYSASVSGAGTAKFE